MSLAQKLPLALFAALLVVPALAAPGDPAPAPRAGGTLNIPGLPPIQLPPGARAFDFSGPGVGGEDASPRERIRPAPGAGVIDEEAAPEKPRRDARKPPRRAPASVATMESRRASVLDALFKQLHDADSDGAPGVAEAIQRVWLKSGSDTADLLMARALHALGQKDMKLAEDVLDSVVEIAPDWAEGWNKRATVRFFADDLAGSMSDIERTLKLEPRHFGALAGLGAILQKSGLDKRALEAFRKALDVYPHQPDLEKTVDKLRLEVEGRDI